MILYEFSYEKICQLEISETVLYIILFKSVNICLIYLAAPVLDNIYLQYDGQFILLISCLSLSYNAFFVSYELLQCVYFTWYK